MGIGNPNIKNYAKKFTSTYQPANAGRKPSQLKKFIKENGIGSEDVSLMMKNIILAGKTFDDLKKLLEDETQPMVIRLFIKAFLTDFKNGTLNNFEIFLNRIFGNPKQPIQFEQSITQISPEQREELLKDLLKKNKDKITEILNEENNTN